METILKNTHLNKIFNRKLHAVKNVSFEIKKGKITQEWLYKIDSIKKGNETLLFERKNGIITFGQFEISKKNNLPYIKEFIKIFLTEGKYSVLLTKRYYFH